MQEQANIIDKADAMREAAGDLAVMYTCEGRQADADAVIAAFAALPDESAARLYDIIRNL